MAGAAASVLTQLLALLALAASSLVFGRAVLSRMHFDREAERGVFSLAVGMGLIGEALFLLGLARALYVPLILVLLLLAHAACWRIWRELWRGRHSIRSTALLVAAAVAIPSLVLSLYPPTSFDETMYHLPYAKIFAREHAVVFAETLRFPIFPQLAHMIFTALYEAFFTYVRVGAFGALCLAFPFMAAQLWWFIAPGLYRHERSAFWPFLLATPVMFILGAAFVYYLILPFAIKFFLGFETPGGNGQLPIELQARVGEYLSFVTTLIFAFGFCFELPVLLTLLGRVGIVTSAGLASARRYAIVGVVAVAAVVTPPDVFSQLALAVPLVGLYEVSIWCVYLMERGRAKREAAEAAAARNIQTT